MRGSETGGGSEGWGGGKHRGLSNCKQQIPPGTVGCIPRTFVYKHEADGREIRAEKPG